MVPALGDPMLDLVQGSVVMDPHLHKAPAIRGVAAVVETDLVSVLADSFHEQVVNVPGFRIRDVLHQG